jgi:hypothetical protein
VFAVGEIINLVLVEQARPKFTAKVPKVSLLTVIVAASFEY